MKRNRKNHSPQICGVVLGALALCMARAGQAQIATDGTTGAAGALGGPNFQIPASLGQKIGGNLFHSFSDFNIRSDQSATFSGPASIQNILSRVTGGRTSVIDGQLNSTIAGANFFFLNPAGIVFGPNAQVNVGGDFAASTADALRLGNGGVFHALDASQSVLTGAAPEAFGFLAPRPNSISIVGSNLFATPGKAISFVGGDISLRGALVANSDGNIHLTSVGSAGDARLPQNRNDAMDVSGFSKLGSVSMTNGAAVVAVESGGVRVRAENLSLDGENTFISHQSNLGAAGNGIDIALRGEAVLQRGGALLSLAEGENKGGGILLRADAVRISGTNGFATGIVGRTSQAGAGGDVSVETKTLVLQGDAYISLATTGAARGGNAQIKADTILLDGRGAQVANGVFADTTGRGGGGDIRITARLLQADNAIIRSSTFGRGKSGAITLDVSSVRLINGSGVVANSFSSGAGGDISVKADSIYLDRQDALTGTGFASESRGLGRGGSVSLRAREIQILNGATISVDTFQSGKGGDVSIVADKLLLDGKNSALSTGIAAETASVGKGGSVSIAAREVRIENGARILASTYGAAGGGNVEIKADTISMDRKDAALSTGIGAETYGDGKGGSIRLSARSLSVVNGAGVSVGSFLAGEGGNIAIDVDTLVLDGQGAPQPTSISAETGGTGKGGSLAIDARNLTVADGARISATAFASGGGGDIVVRAGSVLLDGKTSKNQTGIYASTGTTSNGGNGGQITVEADSLQMLNQSLVSTSTQGGGNGGDITVRAGDVALDKSGIASIAQGSGEAGSVIIEARGNVIVDNEATIAVASYKSNGGDIKISAGDSIVLLNSGNIDAQAFDEGTPRNGGNVELVAGRLLFARDGDITAKATGNGGNLRAQARFIVFNRSEVNANAIQRNGGNISINALVYLPSIESRITASSELGIGIDGTIAIQSPYSNVGGLLSALPSDPLGAESSLAERCIVLRTGGNSSFTIDVRRRVPSQPGDLLLSSTR